MEFTISYGPNPNARTMVNAASARIWSIVGLTAVFLGYC
jgi:hypothetical protein